MRSDHEHRSGLASSGTGARFERKPERAGSGGVLRAVAASACLAALVSAQPAAGQQPQADFRVDVDLVRLNVAVVDPSGGQVPVLGAEDFRVYEDGVEQAIELFLRPSEAPLDVALVLDSSTSMRPAAGTARRAATAFLGQLEIDDCAYVLPFTESVGPGRWGSAKDPMLWSFVDRVEMNGGTALYDALLAGLTETERGVSGSEIEPTTDPSAGSEDVPASGPEPVPTRPDTEQAPPRSGGTGTRGLSARIGAAVGDLAAEAPPPVDAKCGPGSSIRGDAGARGRPELERRLALVLLSDGGDMNSEAGFDRVLVAARRSSVPIFPLVLGYAREDQRLKARLAELARATGGRLIESVQPDRLQVAYREVLSYLRSSYVLGYDPGPLTAVGAGAEGVERASGPDSLLWHDVRVELRRPKLQAIVRPGYYR